MQTKVGVMFRKICVLGAALLLSAISFAEESSKQPASLYDRLGGYEAISAVVNDLMPRLISDPQLGRFWANRGNDGVQREKQLVINFIVNRAGGPLFYAGREMELSHKGMKISESDWRIFMEHLRATLENSNCIGGNAAMSSVSSKAPKQRW